MLNAALHVCPRHEGRGSTTLIRTLKAIAVLGTAYVALIACPGGGTEKIPTPPPIPSTTTSVAAASPTESATESATPLPSATESAAASSSESATTAPTEATTTAPTTAPTSAPTQATTAAPTTAPTTAPTVAPTPVATTPAPPANPWTGYLFAPNASGAVPPSFTRYGATVVDASSGAPVVGACVYTGPPSGCPTKGVNKTDANGFFAVDLPSGSAFAFNIQSDPQNAIYAALIQITVPSGTNTTLKMTHK